MRVRIREHPLGGIWYVEKKFLWQWQYVESFSGDMALERATKYAERLLRPNIVEIK